MDEATVPGRCHSSIVCCISFIRLAQLLSENNSVIYVIACKQFIKMHSIIIIIILAISDISAAGIIAIIIAIIQIHIIIIRIVIPATVITVVIAIYQFFKH